MTLQAAKIRIKDNSGAQVVQSLRVYGYSKNKPARVGQHLLVSIKKFVSNKKIVKTKLYTALLITSAKKFFRKDGSSIKFDSSTAIIVDKRNSFTPIASRVTSCVAKELKGKSRARLISLAKGTM